MNPTRLTLKIFFFEPKNQFLKFYTTMFSLYKIKESDNPVQVRPSPLQQLVNLVIFFEKRIRAVPRAL